MINKNKRWRQWTKLPLAAAVAAIISAPAQAFQFYLGDIEGSLDTTLTAGASWRISDRDKNQLSPGNQGLCEGGSGCPGPYSEAASSHNSDNGNWNFKQGETYSKIIKGTSDLMLRYGDYGGFTRLRYFYDKELMDEGRAYDEVGQTRPLNDQALEQAGADVRFLDAYVWGDWYFGDTPVNARLGRQVVSWGESTFILGGVNIINPIDASAARAPGAEVKDVLLPVNMFYTSVGLSEDLTTEFFYQIEWEKAEADPCGTFFSNSDSAADGCGGIVTTAQLPESQVINLDAGTGSLVNERLGDREPDNNGQYGLAVRWYAADLGDTEFGFYYINYHSRLPYASFVKGSGSGGVGAKYFIEYPEDIQLFGISFNTSTDSGWSIGGEVTHRPKLPIQKNSFELTAASKNQPYSAFYDAGASAGDTIRGYDEFAVTQAQVTFIKFIDQILGASRLTFVSEVGAVFVHDLPNNSRYGRDSTYGTGPVVNDSGASCEAVNLNPSFCEDEGFVTDFSAGYRMRFTLDYPNVFAGINLEPSLAWSHDVKGYAPEPGAPFKEGSKAVGLTLKGVYLNKYSASIGYTNYFGGEPYNYLNDRDNVSASVSVSF
ncbi:DUF1302 domain-containing protein [Hahella sp. NBU794]|uniref:DUF1302 domain-containing protein n=1 Tax=Hahella sp. NBU794 TaxID=3422590 RepID=UPI003D6FBB25